MQPPRALGKGTSIAVNDKKVAIAYYDNTVKSLKVAMADTSHGAAIQESHFEKAMVDGTKVDPRKTGCSADKDCGEGYLSCDKAKGFCQFKTCDKDDQCGTDGKCVNKKCTILRSVALGDRTCKKDPAKKDEKALACKYHRGFTCQNNLCQGSLYRDRVGDFPELKFGPDGKILISYFDFDNKSLAFIKGANLAELSKAKVSLVDTGVTPGDMRFVGAESAIAIDENGLPVIAFQDTTYNDLYVTSIDSANTTVKGWDVFKKPTFALQAGVFGFYLKLIKVGKDFYLGHYHIETEKTGSLVKDKSKYEITKVKLK